MPTTLTLAAIERAIRDSWGPDTADDVDDWSVENPSRSQCGVTALVVRALLGGEILLADVHRDGEFTDGHVWNRLASGVEVDLTAEQFTPEHVVGEPWVGDPRVLTEMPERCRLLADRVAERLGVPVDVFRGVG